MLEEQKNYRRKLILFFLSEAWEDTQRFHFAFGDVLFRVTTCRGKLPPRIIQKYFDFGNGTIGNLEDWNAIKYYFIVKNQVCLEIIRDFENWQSKISSYDSRKLAGMQSLIGYIHLPNLEDKSSVDDIVETMKLVPDYPYVIAVQKSDAEHDWHNDYPILTSPETLTYDLDDIESVANVYRKLVAKMPIGDEDKQEFFDCIAWQVANQDRW